MLVKICGVKTPELAHSAAMVGVDFIGLVFDPTSRRYVAPGLAKEVAMAAKEGGAQVVGVFVQQEMLYLYQDCCLDILQLHSREVIEASRCLSLEVPRIYVVYDSIPSKFEEGRDFLLYDHATPGSGCRTDWNSLEPHREHRFFLAGGLDPNNVRRAIDLVQPYGVDVSSGVENENGEKDKRLIRAFVEAVK